ncbi:MAG: type 4a pilus biogenesis protein PilO [Gammaproteobacteria bacterium]|nr:type 4a pilus biogenesis protein PilO [Gammaproteobacteria bacterium]
MALQDSLDQLKSIDFNNLDINNIGSWPGVVKMMLMVVSFCLVIGVGYYWHVLDKQDNLVVVEREEVDLRKEYENKAQKAANLDAYRQQKKEMEEAFGALLRQLPSDTEVPGLIDDITRTALDNELTIQSIDLQVERNTEFYVELPIEIVVEGDYHKIGAFVSSVANLSRIVTLHDFQIAPQRDTQMLRMQITAKTYRYLEEKS